MTEIKKQIMPPSFKWLRTKIQMIEEKLSEVRLKKGEFGKDGDPWDDPVLYDLESQEKVFMRQISDLKDILTGAEMMSIPEQEDFVVLGHRVLVKLPDDEYAPKEGIHVTIVSEHEATLLHDKYNFNNENELIIASNTPLAIALLGGSKGSIVNYNNAMFRAAILEIKPSPLFQEL